MSAGSGIARCLRCDRMVATHHNRYVNHSAELGGEALCRLSRQHVPIDGHRDSDYIARAHLVATLACQVQDEDPSICWDYLTVLPANEIQRLLMIALAAVPVSQTVESMFSWVTQLPAAKAVTA